MITIKLSREQVQDLLIWLSKKQNEKPPNEELKVLDSIKSAVSKQMAIQENYKCL